MCAGCLTKLVTFKGHADSHKDDPVEEEEGKYTLSSHCPMPSNLPYLTHLKPRGQGSPVSPAQDNRARVLVRMLEDGSGQANRR